MELLLGIILILVLWISFDVLHISYQVKSIEKELFILSNNLDTLATFLLCDVSNFINNNLQSADNNSRNPHKH